MKEKDALWQRKHDKKEQNHILDIKIWTEIVFGWGLESWYQIFEVIPIIRIVSCGDERARRSRPWLGFVESEKETEMRWEERAPKSQMKEHFETHVCFPWLR